jgi:hypothetical protein
MAMEPALASVSSTGSRAARPAVYARRALIVAWLGLSVIGALNFKLLFGRFFDARGGLTAVLPHLKFGHVMFDRVPDAITVPSVTFTTGGGHRGLSEVIETDSIGYADARAYLGFVLDPSWESRICEQIAARNDVVLWLRRIEIGDAPRVVSERALRCENGRAP